MQKITRRDCVSTKVTKKDQGECILLNKQELVATDMKKDEVLGLLSHSSLAVRPPSQFSPVSDSLDSCVGKQTPSHYKQTAGSEPLEEAEELQVYGI